MNHDTAHPYEVERTQQDETRRRNLLDNIDAKLTALQNEQNRLLNKADAIQDRLDELQLERAKLERASLPIMPTSVPQQRGA